MSTITIRVECLKAVANFVSKEETRYYLNGVFFDKSGLLVATDGHRLAAIKPAMPILSDDEKSPLKWDNNGQEFILPSSTIKSILQVKPGSNRLPLYVSFNIESSMATVYHHHDHIIAAFPYKVVDGTFPDFRRVIPKADKFDSNNRVKEDKKKNIEADDTINVQSFNPKFLGDFIGFGKNVTMFQNIDLHAPCLFRAKNELFDALGVLMPMWGDLFENQIIPAWLDQTKEEKKEKKDL